MKEDENLLLKLNDFSYEKLVNRMPNNDDEWESECPETVFIIGNGLIENGWQPYKEHLLEFKKRFSSEAQQKIIKEQHLSMYLARHAYKCRFQKYRAIEHALTIDEYIDSWIDSSNKLNKTTEQIRTRYENASKSKKTEHASFKIKENGLLDIVNQSSIGVITTNWDSLLFDDDVFGKNIIQLHGKCDVKDSLILPTQYVVDDLLTWNLIDSKNISDKNKEQLISIKRSRKVSNMLYDAHIIAEGWLRKAKNIVVAGTSFNSYDSELLSVLPVDNNANFEKLVIANNNEEHSNIIAMSFAVYDSRRKDRSDLIRN